MSRVVVTRILFLIIKNETGLYIQSEMQGGLAESIALRRVGESRSDGSIRRGAIDMTTTNVRLHVLPDMQISDGLQVGAVRRA